jgi:L-lactate dehydrogenase complex protein LldG
MTTRAAFFERLRGQVLVSPGSRGAASSERVPRSREAMDLIRRQLAERWPQTLARFRAEFERVGGVFHRVAVEAAVPDMVAGIARERELGRIVTWHGDTLGAGWGEALTGKGLAVETMPPGALADEATRPALRRAIAEADLGLTGVDLAVAETGSLVLVSGAGRPRSTSLVPPVHVAVFGPSSLVESLAQLGVYLAAWHGDGAPRWRGGAVNIITGPSRTADIELTLTMGVHGPKELHAVFVDADVQRVHPAHA